MVSSIHFLTAFLSPRAEAETPITIVRLDDNRQSVITVEKMMLDEGYASISYRALAAKAGVTPSLVQYYFPALDDIVTSLQLRNWFEAPQRSITHQTYGSQLLWRFLDVAEPQLLPLLLSDASGSWLVHHGALSLDSALTVSDRDANPRFYPLKSNDVHLTFGGDYVRAVIPPSRPSKE